MRQTNLEEPDRASMSPQDISPQDISPQDISPQDISPQDISPQDIATIEQDIDPEITRIMVACMPKSGSTFLAKSLAQIMGWPELQAVFGYGRCEQNLYYPRLSGIANDSGVIQQHLRATETHLVLLEKFRMPPVVLVRNLFDVVASLYDHWHQESVVGFLCHLNKHFHELDRNTKLDLIIDLALPWYINFYAGWYDVWLHKTLRMLWVTYEELISDNVWTIRKILQFYGIRKSDEEIIAGLRRSSKLNTRFNKGIRGRGLNELSQLQADKIRAYARYYPWVDFSQVGLDREGVPHTRLSQGGLDSSHSQTMGSGARQPSEVPDQLRGLQETSEAGKPASRQPEASDDDDVAQRPAKTDELKPLWEASDAKLAAYRANIYQMSIALETADAKLFTYEAESIEIKAASEAAKAKLAEYEVRIEEIQQRIEEMKASSEAASLESAHLRRLAGALAHEADALRDRRIARLVQRFRGKSDLCNEVAAPFQRLKDDSLLFSSSRRGYRLQPSFGLHRVPFLQYPLRLDRPNLAAVSLAPMVDLTPTSGVIGIKIVAPDKSIVAQQAIPASQIDRSLPTRFAFPPIADSDRGQFKLRVFVRDVDLPVRLLEWRKYSCFGFGRLETRAFCAFHFDGET